MPVQNTIINVCRCYSYSDGINFVCLSFTLSQTSLPTADGSRERLILHPSTGVRGSTDCAILSSLLNIADSLHKTVKQHTVKITIFRNKHCFHGTKTKIPYKTPDLILKKEEKTITLIATDFDSDIGFVIANHSMWVSVFLFSFFFSRDKLRFRYSWNLPSYSL